MKTTVTLVDYRNHELIKLSDLVEHKNGKPITGDEKQVGGEYDVMGGGMDYNGKYSSYNRDGETISVSKSGASAGFVKYHDSKYWAGDCFTITPSNTKTIIKYLYYYFKGTQKMSNLRTSGSTIPHCKWDDVSMLEVSIPPLELQTLIVERLDKLQEQIICLEQIETHADEAAKFILDGYLGV